MNRIIFSLVVVVATWILLLIGGIVNPMGASLACPDWYFIPTCNGQLLPRMVGGVLYEHGHRLWASMVGLLTLMLAVWLGLSKDVDKTTKWAAMVALFLVALQGTFGGVTVLLGLNAILSTMHLVTAMVFFCLLIFIAFRLMKNSNPIFDFLSEQHENKELVSARQWIGVATVFVLLQILLGGMIRHIGAGLACGDDWIACGPTFWPNWHLAQMHMLHRFVAYALLVFILVAVTKLRLFARRHDLFLLSKLSWLPLLLVAAQIILGLATVATVRSVTLVVMHTSVGALLLGSLFWFYLLLTTAASNKRIAI